MGRAGEGVGGRGRRVFAEEFCITYDLSGVEELEDLCREFEREREKCTMDRVRNSLIHGGREVAERIAARHAERFGHELWRALRKALDRLAAEGRACVRKQQA